VNRTVTSIQVPSLVTANASSHADTVCTPHIDVDYIVAIASATVRRRSMCAFFEGPLFAMRGPTKGDERLGLCALAKLTLDDRQAKADDARSRVYARWGASR
jgi:hypothetical protein